MSTINQIIRNTSRTKNIDQSDADTSLHTPDEILNQICSSIIRNSEYDIVRQVHDIIIKNVNYNNTGRPIDHEMLGPLINKEGVCDGISKLTRIILQKLNIDSYIATGVINIHNNNQGPHAWNVVKINDRWYHVDVTADLDLTDKS